MPFNQVPKQDGVKVFLVRLDPKVSAEAGDFGEAASLPVFLEGLLDEEPPLRRQCAFDLLSDHKNCRFYLKVSRKFSGFHLCDTRRNQASLYFSTVRMWGQP
jgi:hypothetical protein